MDSSKETAFTEFLQTLHPSIKWTVSCGKKKNFLDLTISITEDGNIETDVYAKSCSVYLPPNSCHPPSVFKGLAIGIGTRLRMLISDDAVLDRRLQEYAKYLTASGWQWSKAIRDLKKGAARDRCTLLQPKRKTTTKKIAWVTQYDPRVPSKANIINENLHLLHANPENIAIFPKGSIVAASRKRKNLGQLYKPTVPRRFVQHGPEEKPGFFPCTKCDTCRHSKLTTTFTSPWDKRRWHIRKHHTCKTPNVVYTLTCSVHPDFWYVGSTTNLRLRWANHKSDTKLKKIKKCMMAYHVNSSDHPHDPNFGFLNITPIEQVADKEKLLSRETYWAANLGTLMTGLNRRKDLNTALNQRIHYTC